MVVDLYQAELDQARAKQVPRSEVYRREPIAWRDVKVSIGRFRRRFDTRPWGTHGLSDAGHHSAHQELKRRRAT